MSELATVLQYVLIALATGSFWLAMWILSSVSSRIASLEQSVKAMSAKCESHSERITYIEAKTNGGRK